MRSRHKNLNGMETIIESEIFTVDITIFYLSVPAENELWKARQSVDANFL